MARSNHKLFCKTGRRRNVKISKVFAPRAKAGPHGKEKSRPITFSDAPEGEYSIRIAEVM